MRNNIRGYRRPQIPFWARFLYIMFAFGNIVMRVFYAFYNRKHLLKALEDDDRIEIIMIKDKGKTKTVLDKK